MDALSYNGLDKFQTYLAEIRRKTACHSNVYCIDPMLPNLTQVSLSTSTPLELEQKLKLTSLTFKVSVYFTPV